MKQCKKCGGSYPEVFFRVNRETWRGANHRTSSICIGCELTSRTTRKCSNRTLEKAIKAIGHHALKYGMKRSDFREQYGWDSKQMAHDIEHAMLNGCPYCFRPFSEMAHGLADLSIDIIDRSKPPYYSTNTKWVCVTCNAEKQHMPPELWEQKKRAWAEWTRNQERINHNPLSGLPLFEGLKTQPMLNWNGQYILGA